MTLFPSCLNTPSSGHDGRRQARLAILPYLMAMGAQRQQIGENFCFAQSLRRRLWHGASASSLVVSSFGSRRVQRPARPPDLLGPLRALPARSKRRLVDSSWPWRSVSLPPSFPRDLPLVFSPVDLLRFVTPVSFRPNSAYGFGLPRAPLNAQEPPTAFCRPASGIGLRGHSNRHKCNDFWRRHLRSIMGSSIPAAVCREKRGRISIPRTPPSEQWKPSKLDLAAGLASSL